MIIPWQLEVTVTGSESKSRLPAEPARRPECQARAAVRVTVIMMSFKFEFYYSGRRRAGRRWRPGDPTRRPLLLLSESIWNPQLPVTVNPWYKSVQLEGGMYRDRY